MRESWGDIYVVNVPSQRLDVVLRECGGVQRHSPPTTVLQFSPAESRHVALVSVTEE